MRPCIECGTPAIPLGSRKQVCSPKCQNRRRERQRGSGRKGPQCGKRSTYRKGCRCDECKAANAASSRAYRTNYAVRTGEPRERKYRPLTSTTRTCETCGGETRSRAPIPECAACGRRRRRTLNLSTLDRLSIYERDGWTCQFCSEPVDKALMGSSSAWEPTLDHIIPRSKGGSDDLDNLRLLHRYCNSVRSNREALTLAELTA